MPILDSKTKDKIIIKGARVNNLKNVSVAIPKNKLVVVTGLSGSGKSSLAFDVVYAEGNRRYLEGMSSYARQFLEISGKPDVDKIENLSPTIAIDQKSVSRSPRSTVGTLTEIYDYLRVLFAKAGTPHCPNCNLAMSRKSRKEILEEIMALPDKTHIVIAARILEKGKDIEEILKNIGNLGFARVRIGGKVMLLEEAVAIIKAEDSGEIGIVVDRMILKSKSPDWERISDSVETAFKLGKGFVVVAIDSTEERFYNRDFVCPGCRFKISEITPKHFSFNSPEGACTHCSGMGNVKEVDEDLVAPNKKLSLSEGAILAWNKSGQENVLNLLRSLGEKYKFSVDAPLEKLTREQLNVIFYGCPEFEGVIPGIKKKYEEISSSFTKSDIEKYMIEKTCPVCQGKRLKAQYLSILVGGAPPHQSDKDSARDLNNIIEQKNSDKQVVGEADWCGGKSIDDVVRMDMTELVGFLSGLKDAQENPSKKEIIAPLVKEMVFKAEALQNVGLGYLALFRSANSLSGGEGQRIRLSTQIGAELSGIIYVLDEPSIGLHSRDTEKLIFTLKALKDLGNSLIVVEHDKDIMEKADWVIDMGPGAGEFGGEVIFEGDMKKLLKAKTETALYLSGKKKVAEKRKKRGGGKFLEIIGAGEHNLKNIDVKIPLEKFVTITGVSGSGKSTLMADILAKALAKHFFRAKDIPGKHKKIKGLSQIDKVISINQSPIGRTPRSNAATYTGVFSLIRELFAETEEAVKMGFPASRFSFNVRGGRCEDCQGDGIKKIEMHLLPDMYVKCETCGGSRYNQKTLSIEYQGVNIAQVLDMSVSYALKFFHRSPLIVEKLKTLEDVGLGYLKLGQSATSLSGGEAQRIKLATELARRSTGKTLYILDEPTIGLHFEDTKKLLHVLNALADKGNTILAVEHNPDVIRNSDWIIDLGPEGGNGGGEIVYAGSPEGLKKCKRSWTGRYL
ncbi:MAG: Excinuclease subunit [Patescibacteria group bacterium]|nr:Excinuclease subunit [Patescibacteria group bacterium]